MNYQQWIEDVSELLGRLDTLDIPYPLGSNVVVRKTSAGVHAPLTANPAVTAQIGQFYAVCDGISWPDIRSGYFLVKGDELGRVKDDATPTSIIGESSGSVLMLGSNGGGTLFAARRTSGDILSLPPGEIINNVYNNSDGRANLIARDFDGFLIRLKEDLAAFVQGDSEFGYID
ncbi:MAG: hypothetical protein AAF660_14930 [Pseudomonadota bacterium]